MRVLLGLCLLCSACTDKADAESGVERIVERIRADHALHAFGGRLLGTDRGEWIGRLLFENDEGGLETILRENVHGIVENRAGVFAFTGLLHLQTNVGFIYRIDLTRNLDVNATRLGRLPGAPFDVTPHADGITTFLVAGRYDPKGRRIYDCYELAGQAVRHSYRCAPPSAATF